MCTVANIKDDSGDQLPKPTGAQTDFATGKRVLTIQKQGEDVQMVQLNDQFNELGQGGEVRKRRLSSDNKSELLHKALISARPLLVLLRLVDTIKKRWDGKRLGILGQTEDQQPR